MGVKGDEGYGGRPGVTGQPGRPGYGAPGLKGPRGTPGIPGFQGWSSLFNDLFLASWLFLWRVVLCYDQVGLALSVRRAWWVLQEDKAQRVTAVSPACRLSVRMVPRVNAEQL